MATKMKIVANFRRSLSFPDQPSNFKHKKTFHVRSTSLPCRTHPLISQLKDDISNLKTWAVSKPNNRNSAWLCDGLSRLKTIHESLHDLLQLPQIRESLHEHYQWVEKILEDFLRFVDVYGIFQTLILTLKQEHMAAQVAFRRRDDAKTILYIKALKKTGKEMVNLISTVQTVGAPDRAKYMHANYGDAEIEGIISDVNEVTMAVSFALFGGISSSFCLQKSAWKGLILPKKEKKVEEIGIEELELVVGMERCLWGLRNKGDEEVKVMAKKMYDMESCLGGIECGADKLFRSLINSRVSMLNVLTQY